VDNLKANLDYGEESIIARSPDGSMQVRTPAFPIDCDYVRVVRIEGDDVIETAYWNAQEWTESEDQGVEVMGAIMGAIKEVVEFEG